MFGQWKELGVCACGSLVCAWWRGRGSLRPRKRVLQHEHKKWLGTRCTGHRWWGTNKLYEDASTPATPEFNPCRHHGFATEAFIS